MQIIKLDGYNATVDNGKKLELGTFDSYGEEQLQIVKAQNWENLSVIATFNPPNKKPVQVVVDSVTGVIKVPKEATANLYGVGTIVFVGLADGVQRISADVEYIVRKHSNANGTEPAEPTPSVVEQILTEAQNANTNSAQAKKLATDAKDIAQSVRDDADNGKFNGKDGKDGAKGDKGETGTTPQLKIGEDNLWQVSYNNGATWVSLGVKATGDAGKDGKNGLTPYIGENGNWWLGNTDTGVSAKGPKGDPGPQGPAGEIPEDYPQIREDVSQLEEDTAVLQKRQNVLVGSETGNPASCNDAFAAPLCGLTVYGKSTQDGTPTPDAPVPIVSAGDGGSVAVKVTGANMLEGTKPGVKSTVNGITYTTYENGILITGTATDACNIYLHKDKNEIHRLTRGIYYITTRGLSPSATINFYFIGNLSSDVQNTKVWLTKDVEYSLILQILKGASLNATVQVSLTRDKTTAYSPYREQLLTLPTPNGLPGIPVTSGGNYTDPSGQQWICDEVDLERGVKVQRVNVVDLSTCTITVTANLVATKRLTIKLPLNGLDYKTESICNKLPFVTSFTKDIPHFYVDKSNAHVFIPIDAKNPEEGEYILFYALATPIEIPLTPAEIAAYKALTAYAPDTVVQASDGAGIKLDYQRDVNLVVKNLEDAIASMTTTT